MKSATNYLLGVARQGDSDLGHDAIFPATLADSVIDPAGAAQDCPG